MSTDSHGTGSSGTGPSSKAKKAAPQSAAELEAELKAKRAALADTVDQLTAQLDPRQNVADLKAQLTETAANTSDEARAFLDRIRSGDQRALETVGFPAAAALAVLGIALIRRRR